jgi:hypothetical protein
MLIKTGRAEKYKLRVKIVRDSGKENGIDSIIVKNIEEVNNKKYKDKIITSFDCERNGLKSPIRGRRPTTAST